MIRTFRFFWSAVLLVTALASVPAMAGEQYQPAWDSLTRHRNPQWLVDAKFGIYAHWGVYAIPAFGNEWYAKRMYDPKDPKGVFEFHRQTYGTQDKFGYKDFVPMFQAEKFDPNEWAEIIRQSGARYAGIAVVHHDGFGLWHSKVYRWNAGVMGPKRDLYGELVKALRGKGIKTVATEHHMRTFNWYLPNDERLWDRLKRENADLFDPRYADLYWNQFTSKKEDFLKQWRAKLLEVIDNYRPDVLWFDGGDFTSPEVSGYVLGALAHYYNQADGKSEVEVLNKFAATKKFNFPREFGILTFEAGRDRPEQVDRPWIDDLSIAENSWGYIRDLQLRPAREILLGLVDRVSRGGGLLLSLAPKASGEIPDDQKAILREIGDWLKINGEAIYGTRPWRVHAEGSTAKLIYTKGEHTQWSFAKCSAEDIRFTRKGNTLYAIALGWPADGKLNIQTLKGGAKVGIRTISMLGSQAPLKWSQTPAALVVELPAQQPCKHAYALKIAVRGNWE